MGIAHRDVKPRNILIFLLNEGEVVKPQIKLADFGINNILQDAVGENESIENPTGTAMGYMQKFIAPRNLISKQTFSPILLRRLLKI